MLRDISRGKAVLITLDRLVNVLCNGCPEEAFSSRAWRWERDGKRAWPRKLIDALFFRGKGHCRESFESERLRRQLPPEITHPEDPALLAKWGTDQKAEAWRAAVTLAFKRIKSVRDKRLSEYRVLYRGNLISIDKEAIAGMTNTALQFALGAIDSVRWKTSGDIHACLNREEFMAIYIAANKAVREHYAVEESKQLVFMDRRSAPDVLAWLEEPDNLDSGWPPLWFEPGYQGAIKEPLQWEDGSWRVIAPMNHEYCEP